MPTTTRVERCRPVDLRKAVVVAKAALPPDFCHSTADPAEREGCEPRPHHWAIPTPLTHTHVSLGQAALPAANTSAPVKACVGERVRPAGCNQASDQLGPPPRLPTADTTATLRCHSRGVCGAFSPQLSARRRPPPPCPPLWHPGRCRWPSRLSDAKRTQTACRPAPPSLP